MTSSRSVTNKASAESSPSFPELPQGAPEKVRRYKSIEHPIWADHEARFIQQYLRYFIQITKHGVYIDGFSGPQYTDRLEARTDSQVLASEPKWLRRFYLCELRQQSVQILKYSKSALKSRSRVAKGSPT
jgi:hypothetical protein